MPKLFLDGSTETKKKKSGICSFIEKDRGQALKDRIKFHLNLKSQVSENKQIYQRDEAHLFPLSFHSPGEGFKMVQVCQQSQKSMVHCDHQTLTPQADVPQRSAELCSCSHAEFLTQKFISKGEVGILGKGNLRDVFIVP